jgi:hypothetical protein
MVAVRGNRRTWCRFCGIELRLPLWKSVIGLNVGYCEDQQSCLAWLQAQRAATVRPAVVAEQEPEPSIGLRLSHRIGA